MSRFINRVAWPVPPLAIVAGGTGATTQAEAANNILPIQTGHIGHFLTTDGSNVSWVSIAGAGIVSSVSNSDSTLTIFPTTGSVLASLNLTHSNAWTATQLFQSTLGIELGKDVTSGANIGGSIKIWSAGDNAFYTTLTAGTQTANETYTLPTAMPTVSGCVLSATDAGVMSWFDLFGTANTWTDTQSFDMELQLPIENEFTPDELSPDTEGLIGFYSDPAQETSAPYISRFHQVYYGQKGHGGPPTGYYPVLHYTALLCADGGTRMTGPFAPASYDTPDSEGDNYFPHLGTDEGGTLIDGFRNWSAQQDTWDHYLYYSSMGQWKRIAYVEDISNMAITGPTDSTLSQWGQTLQLNLDNANTWTAAQTFTGTTDIIASISNGYISTVSNNGVPISSLDYTGRLSIPKLDFNYIPAPADTMTIADAYIDGNLNGVYAYQVTYIDVYGNETDTYYFSTPMDLTVSNSQIILSDIPISTDIRVAKRNIYRTTGTRGSFAYPCYLVHTLDDNVTTTWIDNISDGSLDLTRQTPYENATSSNIYFNGSRRISVEKETVIIGDQAAGYGLGRVSMPGNIFIGNQAGYNEVTTGHQNVYIGSHAAHESTDGAGNVYIGSHAAHDATTGHRNVAIGTNSGYNIGIGNRNTMLGALSGFYDEATHGSTYIGYGAGLGISGDSLLDITGSDSLGAIYHLITGDFVRQILTLGVTGVTGSTEVTGTLNCHETLNCNHGIYISGVDNGRGIPGVFNNVLSASYSNYQPIELGNTPTLARNSYNPIIIGTTSDALYAAWIRGGSAYTLSTGTDLGIGTYYYKFRYIFADGSASSLSDPITVTTVSGSQIVNLTKVNIYTGPLNCVSRQIFRSILVVSLQTAETIPYFLLSTIEDNVTTTYTDSTSDSILVTHPTYYTSSSGPSNFTIIGSGLTLAKSNSIALGGYGASTVVYKTDMYLGAGQYSGYAVDFTIHTTDSIGIDIDGKKLRLVGGIATGGAKTGAIVLMGSPAGVSGTLGQTLSEYAWLDPSVASTGGTAYSFDTANALATSDLLSMSNGGIQKIRIDSDGIIHNSATIVGARKYASTITGNGTDDIFTIIHNLDTTDIVVSMWDSSSEEVIGDYDISDNNTITVTFGYIPAGPVPGPAETFRIVVIG